MDREDLELLLADPVAIRRASEALSMCKLSEGDGAVDVDWRSALGDWEDGTVRAIIRSFFGFEAAEPDEPTAVVIFREVETDTLNVQAVFHPPFDHHNPGSNSVAHLAVAEVISGVFRNAEGTGLTIEAEAEPEAE